MAGWTRPRRSRSSSASRSPSTPATQRVSSIATSSRATFSSGVEPGDGSPRDVYLSDFGLTSRAEDEDLTEAGQLVGTLDYLAPEQVEGRPVSARTDVYSFGCVLYQCLTGEVPFLRQLADGAPVGAPRGGAAEAERT